MAFISRSPRLFPINSTYKTAFQHTGLFSITLVQVLRRDASVNRTSQPFNEHGFSAPGLGIELLTIVLICQSITDCLEQCQ